MVKLTQSTFIDCLSLLNTKPGRDSGCWGCVLRLGQVDGVCIGVGVDQVVCQQLMSEVFAAIHCQTMSLTLCKLLCIDPEPTQSHTGLDMSLKFTGTNITQNLNPASSIIMVIMIGTKQGIDT